MRKLTEHPDRHNKNLWVVTDTYHTKLVLQSDWTWGPVSLLSGPVCTPFSLSLSFCSKLYLSLWKACTTLSNFIIFPRSSLVKHILENPFLPSSQDHFIDSTKFWVGYGPWGRTYQIGLLQWCILLQQYFFFLIHQKFQLRKSSGTYKGNP